MKAVVESLWGFMYSHHWVVDKQERSAKSGNLHIQTGNKVYEIVLLNHCSV